MDLKKRIEELEAEVANRRLSESRILDSLASQTREFEQTKSELEESKVEISLLHEEIESLVASSSRRCDGSCCGKIALEKELGYLRFELGLAKANLAKIQERERFASSKAKALSDEIYLIKNELKFAIEAEEKSQKALDDLALVLKEVAAEAYEAKQSASQLELHQVKEEAGQLKHMVRNAEARYQKEIEEKKLAQDEVKAAERMTRAAKREVYKLRGMLKQAINEANTAKVDAGLARDENIQLKDSKAKKEELIRLLTQENERLGINKVAAQENVKDLKRLLSSSAIKTEDKEQEEEHYKDPLIRKTSSCVNLQQEEEILEANIQDEHPKKAKAFKDSTFDINALSKLELHTVKQVSHYPIASSSAFSYDGETLKTENLCISLNKSTSSLNDMDKEQKEKQYEDPQVKKTFSLNHNEFKLQQDQEDMNVKIQDEDTIKAKVLKGSTFDNESPKLNVEPHTRKQVPHHHQRASLDDGGTLKLEDSDSDRSPYKRKRTLFKKVGDLIRRKSFHKIIQ